MNIAFSLFRNVYDVTAYWKKKKLNPTYLNKMFEQSVQCTMRCEAKKKEKSIYKQSTV